MTVSSSSQLLCLPWRRRYWHSRHELCCVYYLGSKLHKVPELRFYTDDSVEHATKIHQLLDELYIPEGTDFMQD